MKDCGAAFASANVLSIQMSIATLESRVNRPHSVSNPEVSYPLAEFELDDVEFMQRMVVMGSSLVRVPAFVTGCELRDGCRAKRTDGRCWRR